MVLRGAPIFRTPSRTNYLFFHSTSFGFRRIGYPVSAVVKWPRSRSFTFRDSSLLLNWPRLAVCLNDIMMFAFVINFFILLFIAVTLVGELVPLARISS